jgi:hypothetical protein
MQRGTPPVTAFLQVQAVPLEPSKIAPWTKVELDSGVRPIPIGDILVDALTAHSSVLVMRSPNIDSPVQELLEIASPAIANRLGSGYSVADLKNCAEALISRKLPRILEPLLKEWVAEPHDFGTRIQLADGLREKIEALVPNCLPTYRTRKLLLFAVSSRVPRNRLPAL